MKIYDANTSAIHTPQTGQTRHVEEVSRTPNRAEPSKEYSADRVELSSLSEKVRLLAADSPERVARVRELAADFRAGRYQVDSLAVSKGIIRDAMARGAASGRE